MTNGSNTERAKGRSVKKYCLQQDVTHGKIRMLYALQLGECEKLTECEKSLPFTASWTCPSDLIHHYHRVTILADNNDEMKVLV